MENTCIYCDGEFTNLNGYLVCNTCEIVYFSKNISPKQKRELIKKHLNNIQGKLKKHQTNLHTIDQKYVLKENLTEIEKEIYKNLSEFQSIRVELEMYIKGQSDLCKKQEQHLLYRLLVLSEWLSKHFESDV